MNIMNLLDSKNSIKEKSNYIKFQINYRNSDTKPSGLIIIESIFNRSVIITNENISMLKPHPLQSQVAHYVLDE